MKIAFYTLGCKVNQYESQSLAEALALEGFSACEIKENPDVIVVNSCAVTAESERKTRQAVRRFKRQNPKSAVVLIGCVPQSFPDAIEKFAGADIVLGNSKPKDLGASIRKYFENKTDVINISPHTKGELYNTPLITEFEGRTRAFMKIEDGCERFCTYCIIPYARGVVRSKPLEEIAKEAGDLYLNGYREVVLTGINLSSFGKGTDYNLCDAVETLANAGIERIRLGSLEPDLITDQMLRRFKAVEGFCDQFHLSLQSGSDATLKRMNRKYDSNFYRDIVNRIRAVFDNPSITTDVMVGFAGETDEEFLESLDFVKQIGFAKSHIFAYSRRAGTFADKMPGQVEESVKTERRRRMQEAANLCEKEFLKTQVGKEANVLFESSQNGVFEGYTENYTKVLVRSDLPLSGEIKRVKITASENDYCLGEIE